MWWVVVHWYSTYCTEDPDIPGYCTMHVWTALLFAALALLCWRPRAVDRLLIDPFPVPSPGASAVLLTGTSSGLGRHAALWLARDGYTVLATVRKAEDARLLAEAWQREKQLEKQLEKQTEKDSGGGDVVPIIMDVTSDESVAAASAAVDALLEERRLDLAAIVNNAGVNANGGILSAGGAVTSYEWNFGVNVFGVVRVTRQFLPAMKRGEKGGRVVNVGSVAGIIAADKGSPYTATKHAMEGMSDAWRRELAAEQISVSLIQPGFIASKMCNRKVCDDAYLPDFSKAVLHAVEDPYPQARYPVAGVVVMPAWLAVWFDALIPDRIADAIINMVAKKSGINADTAGVSHMTTNL